MWPYFKRSATFVVVVSKDQNFKIYDVEMKADSRQKVETPQKTLVSILPSRPPPGRPPRSSRGVPSSSMCSTRPLSTGSSPCGQGETPGTAALAGARVRASCSAPTHAQGSILNLWLLMAIYKQILMMTMSCPTARSLRSAAERREGRPPRIHNNIMCDA